MTTKPVFHIAEDDAVTYLESLGASSVDLVITDPPYESLEKHRAIGTTTRLKQSQGSSNAWFEIFHNHRFPKLMQETYRVLKPNTHFYLFCDQETMFVAKPIAEEAGFRFWKPLVWDKEAIGMGYHYRARYEFILFFEKGKRRLTDLSTPDILSAKRISGGYPTEKPVSIAEILVRQSSEVGEMVCDPFMGSGSTGSAAIGQNRHFTGCDKSPDAVALSRQRLLDQGAAPAEDLYTIGLVDKQLGLFT